MLVSRKWIEWAHTPPSEDGIDASVKLCEMAAQPGSGRIEVADQDLIKELVSVAECYRNPRSGDALYEMGPWWCSQPKKVIEEGRVALRKLESKSAGTGE